MVGMAADGANANRHGSTTSSGGMMAQSVVLPVGAPFGAEQITALNDVFSTSTAEQRAWLSGFLAGVQVANAPQAAAPAAPPKARAPLTILFGTESGNAEALA